MNRGNNIYEENFLRLSTDAIASSDPYLSLDFSPDGMLLFAKTQHTIHVFDMTQGTRHSIDFPYIKDNYDSYVIKVTKQQNTLITSTENGAAICNSKGQVKFLYNSYARLVSCCERSWDDSILLALKDGSIVKLSKSF